MKHGIDVWRMQTLGLCGDLQSQFRLLVGKMLAFCTKHFKQDLKWQATSPLVYFTLPSIRALYPIKVDIIIPWLHPFRGVLWEEHSRQGVFCLRGSKRESLCMCATTETKSLLYIIHTQITISWQVEDQTGQQGSALCVVWTGYSAHFTRVLLVVMTAHRPGLLGLAAASHDEAACSQHTQITWTDTYLMPVTFLEWLMVQSVIFVMNSWECNGAKKHDRQQKWIWDVSLLCVFAHKGDLKVI